MSLSEQPKTPEVLRKIMARDLPREVTVPTMNDFSPPAERERLTKLESELSRTALDEIAYRLSRLTYGEMKEYCEGTACDPDKVWQWATQRAAT
jgi:hypothetical protein